MTYKIEMTRQARKFLLRQPPFQQKRIMLALSKLPAEGDIKHMAGEASNVFRLRIGDYRAIYERHDEIVTILVLDIGNRGDIYK